MGSSLGLLFAKVQETMCLCCIRASCVRTWDPHRCSRASTFYPSMLSRFLEKPVRGHKCSPILRALTSRTWWGAPGCMAGVGASQGVCTAGVSWGLPSRTSSACEGTLQGCGELNWQPPPVPQSRMAAPVCAHLCSLTK